MRGSLPASEVLCGPMAEVSTVPTQSPSEARPYNVGRVIGSLAVVAAVSFVFATVPPLRHHAMDYFQRFSRLAKADVPLFSSRSGSGRGFETMPTLVQDISDALTQEKLASYWVKPEISSGGLIWLLVVEGNWPRVPRDTARAIFGAAAKTHNPACRVVTMPRTGYELAICP
jgi:hypothetical protein